MLAGLVGDPTSRYKISATSSLGETGAMLGRAFNKNGTGGQVTVPFRHVPEAKPLH